MNPFQKLKSEPKPKRAQAGKRHFLLPAILAIVIIIILSLTVFRGVFAGLSQRVTFSHNQGEFLHNSQTSSLFTGFENTLLVSSQTLVQSFSPTGAVNLKESVSMSSPCINSSGKYAVVYDVNGQQALSIKGKDVAGSLNCTNGTTILSATVNEDGYLAVTTKEDGYKAVVTVYRSDFTPVMSIYLSSRYISDAIVTPNNKGIYMLSPSQLDGRFNNTLLYYTMNSNEEPVKEVPLGNNVILALRSSSNVWFIGDKSTIIMDSDARVTGEYDYGGRYLRMGTLGGDRYASVLLSYTSASSSASLLTINKNGELCGNELPIVGQVLALAAAGKNVAVLTTSDIIMSNYHLEKYTSDPNQQGSRNLAVFEDGGAALVNSSTIKPYYPESSPIANDPPEDQVIQEEETES